MSFVLPTDEELMSVKALQEKITAESEFGEYFTNTTVLRFYRGNKGNSANAFEHLVKHGQWRKEYDIDCIDDYTSKFQKQIDAKIVVFGVTDLNGRPTGYSYAHRHDSRDRDINDMCLYTAWIFEKLLKSAKPEEERYIICMDLSVFNVRSIDFELVKEQIGMLQTNYPDTLETLYIVDAPMLFSAAWSVIKLWMDPVTVGKVKFMKRAELEKQFPESVLPLNK